MASIATGLDSVLKKYFELYREKGDLPPILAGQIQAKLAAGLPKTLYFKALEQNHGGILMGRPDEYLELKEKVFAALDHKTRASSPKEVHPSYQLQLDVYTFLLESNQYPTLKTAYLAYYFPNEGALHRGFPFTAEVHEVKTDPKRALKVFQEALLSLQDEPPAPSAQCSFCQWRERLRDF